MSTWVVAGIILTGVWTQLDELGVLGWLPLALTLALDRLGGPPHPARPPRTAPSSLLSALPAVVLCALLLAHVALTAREEFGFGGDEGYHLSATRAFALYYLRAGPVLAAVLVIFAIWRWRGWPHAASVTMLGLMAGSYALPASELFARYPAGFYLLATPLNVVFEVAGVPYPHTANHIVNALSVAAWLFVLRPLVIGRMPDLQVLPAALLIYFQAPSLTFISSTLIEPWSLVFLLLALEALVVYPPEGRWIAVMLAAVATWFKELAVLLLPTFWLLACVNWKRPFPSLRRHAVIVGISALAPFAFYYLLRIDVGIHRTVAPADPAAVWNQPRILEWFTNVTAQLGITAVIGIALLYAVIIRPHVLWAVTAAGLTVFFFAESVGLAYTGYGRFQAFTLIALCGGVIGVAHRMADRRKLAALSIVIFALQVIPFARAFALDFRPDYERNSLEWNGSLVRLPFRALATRIPEARDAGQVRRIRVISFGIELISTPVAYPDLAARYALVLEQQSASAVDCRCRDNAEAVLAGFEWPAHFGDTPEKRTMFEQVSTACVEQINTTCASTILERHRRGAVVGALGVGRVVLIALPQHDQGAKR
jgi:hypothetical protein